MDDKLKTFVIVGNSGVIRWNKEEFKKLNVHKKAKYINSQLEKGLIRAEIYKNIGIAKSTVKGQLEKEYKFNKSLNKFILKECDDKSKTLVINGNNISKDSKNILDIQQDLKSNIVNLAEEYSTIKDMLDWYKNNIGDKSKTSVIEIKSGIKIKLEGTETTRTTIRINKNTWDKFKEFSEIHKEYNQQDLMAQALEEYMDKYK